MAGHTRRASAGPRLVVAASLAATLATTAGAGETWFDSLLARRRAAREAGALPSRAPLPDMGKSTCTVLAWIRTSSDGSILAKTKRDGAWVPHGKALFVRGGRVCYDIGWVGCIEGRTRVVDGEWHHVALVCGPRQEIFVDGERVASGTMAAVADPEGAVVKIGQTSVNFPSGDDRFRGAIDDVRLYARGLSAEEIRAAFNGDDPGVRGLAVRWPLDGDAEDSSGGLNHGGAVGEIAYEDGRLGKALALAGKGHVCVVPAGGGGVPWDELVAKFPDADSTREMAWEREDCVWGADWLSAGAGAVAARYAECTRGPAEISRKARDLADRAKADADLARVREVYVASRLREVALETLARARLADLREFVGEFHGDTPAARALLDRIGDLEARAEGLRAEVSPDALALAAWAREVEALRREVVVTRNPLVGFDEIVFVRRLTYSANHYYTEYVNSRWTPGGGLCVLSLKDGSVRELAPSLRDGVVMRFDVSFDASRIVFDWRCAPQEGYRIYEVGIDGTGLRQLTFPEPDEAEIVRRYRVGGHYHHGTDDMHPCYLPDGGIAFVSTRCQYGILCDAPDDFTTTVVYRMDPDGSNMRRLTNSSVSEASPVVLPDGRIMYTRWEYVDKGAVSVKCLWAMRPDGTATSEIYANDISLPPSFIYGRPIPGVPNGYVVLGTPHYPQNGVGTVIRLDMTRDMRTREPMEYVTPYVDIRGEGGFAFRDATSDWQHDGSGRGPLFRDPYPLSKDLYMVAHKPRGPEWRDPKAYGIYMLDGKGRVYSVHLDPEMSCWEPFPLRPREVPPVPTSVLDEGLAAKGLARCVVTDVYRGMEGVERGTVKYIRVLEQVPRPWATRRRWGGDGYDQQHSCVTKDTHLGLKVQHGVVPVEADGSAHFIVPAMRNIFLQALDGNHMSLQTERTYVNYMAGEVRSCVGCHETQRGAPGMVSKVPKALLRKASVPGPQPGESAGGRPLHYPTDVQPVWDAHCIKCHSGKDPKAGLDLSGELTGLFNVSYESLIPERRGGRGRRSFDLVGPTIGENHPKTGNVHYLPAKSLGSHASVLVAMLSKGKARLADPKAAEHAARLAEKHEKINLSREELLRVTNWVDTNSQYYGAYWGRRNLRYRDHPNFRPVPTFEAAASMTSPIPEEKR